MPNLHPQDQSQNKQKDKTHMKICSDAHVSIAVPFKNNNATNRPASHAYGKEGRFQEGAKNPAYNATYE
jgi:hypothetical protein